MRTKTYGVIYLSLKGNVNQFTKNQINLINNILSYLTNPQTVTFIDWNYSKIGPSGGGMMEGWFERELDYYLNNHGYQTRAKKQRHADLMFDDIHGNNILELNIEIRTATSPSSTWLKNKIISNQGVFEPGMYLYLFKKSKTGRVFKNIQIFLKKHGLYFVWKDLNPRLRVLFATRARWRNNLK